MARRASDLVNAPESKLKRNGKARNLRDIPSGSTHD
jgi:hypothetical protein